MATVVAETCSRHTVFIRYSDKNFPHLGYYVASSGNMLPTFRNTLSVSSSGVTDVSEHPTGFIFRGQGWDSLSPEDGTDTVSRNVGNILPLLAT